MSITHEFARKLSYMSLRSDGVVKITDYGLASVCSKRDVDPWVTPADRAAAKTSPRAAFGARAVRHHPPRRRRCARAVRHPRTAVVSPPPVEMTWRIKIRSLNH